MTSESSKLKVLLVDDDIMNRRIVVSMVDRMGHIADAVESGKDALNRLAEEHYDLVLMDCQMPDLNGYETTALIRCPSSNIMNPGVPIVALTADTLTSTKAACIGAGMNDYLSKPVQMRQLEEMFTRWLKL